MLCIKEKGFLFVFLGTIDKDIVQSVLLELAAAHSENGYRNYV